MRRKRIAGVVMAAGASQRMGRPKQLLAWHGQPLIARSAQAALGAGLDPVVVVIGYRAEEAGVALQTLAVTIVENPAWPEGMSTSMRAGLSALPADVDAAILLLVDQPRLTS
ncbi:MAG TPA: nucleotidyltransferase family protein, partial [Anaerolineae bacterium]|nr:nucleotidyltransferase family protein [Anaerolineae bacterium]